MGVCWPMNALFSQGDTFLHGIHCGEKFLGMLDGGLIAVLLFIGFFISSGDGCKGACAYIDHRAPLGDGGRPRLRRLHRVADAARVCLLLRDAPTT